MPSNKLATLIDTWYPSAQRFGVMLILLITLFIIVLSNPASGDDLTGLAQDDPKDLAMVAAPCAPSGMMFQALPTWARNAVMPPLPETLKPMGKVAVLTTPPTPAPLTPPKETAPVAEAKPEPKPAPPAPAPSPALIAVSPFLQWVQANPQAAAAQARQQAGAYQPAPAPSPGSPAPAATPNANTPTGATVDPYWLPPLIDTAPFGVQSGSSAAIYETPQR